MHRVYLPRLSRVILLENEVLHTGLQVGRLYYTSRMSILICTKLGLATGPCIHNEFIVHVHQLLGVAPCRTDRTSSPVERIVLKYLLRQT